MIFDSYSALSWQQFLAKVEHVKQKADKQRIVVELTEKRPRSLDQNAYLHVIIRYLALQLGYSEEYTKTAFFKLSANKDSFFIGWEVNEQAQYRYPKTRHLNELTQDEVSICIDRFIKWAYDNVGIVLPPPHDKAFVNECAIEVERNKRYL